MSSLAVTVVGHDRPGIIAAAADALATCGMNLEDSSMTLLRGHFAMTLVCAGDAPVEAVRTALEPLSASGLDVAVREVVPDPDVPAAIATHLVTVYGADRLGHRRAPGRRRRRGRRQRHRPHHAPLGRPLRAAGRGRAARPTPTRTRCGRVSTRSPPSSASRPRCGPWRTTSCELRRDHPAAGPGAGGGARPRARARHRRARGRPDRPRGRPALRRPRGHDARLARLRRPGRARRSGSRPRPSASTSPTTPRPGRVTASSSWSTPASSSRAATSAPARAACPSPTSPVTSSARRG